jgi:hypothetical protein
VAGSVVLVAARQARKEEPTPRRSTMNELV